MKRFIFIIFLACLQNALLSQQIWHVKYDASGNNTGVSWQDAFTNLQSALQIAQYGDDVWVAAGTYKPTQSDDRTISFDIPSGIHLAGGFTGTETLFAQRAWNINPTILSGDIGVSGLWEDNSYHVVKIYGGDTLTVLDGFKVMHARGGTFNDPTPHAYGGGLLVWSDELRPVSVPIIQNCTFEQNYATSGGGMACVSRYQEYTSTATVRNCTFLLNKGEYQGGGFSQVGKCLPNRPFIIENCTFSRNYCTQYGGALSITQPTGDIYLRNCSFLNDTVQFEAAAMYLESTENVRYSMDSCTFSFNYAKNGGGGAITHIQQTDTTIFSIRSSVFSHNRAQYNNGGAFVSSSFGMQQILRIEQTRFEHNTSLAGGCGIYLSGGGNTDFQVKIDRCIFLKNLYSNNLTGGGAFFIRGDGSLGMRNYNFISNSLFAYNDGTIMTLGSDPGLLETDVVNCTFLNNGLVPFLKYWTPDFDANFNQKMTILNSLIWEEESPGAYRLFYNNDPDNFNVNNYTVEHCLLNLPTCEYEGIDPCGTGMIYETPPQFVSTDPTMPDLSVPPGSPAINRGSNLVVDTFGLQYDYAGHARILQDTVDIGAFESDSITSGTLDPFFEKESFLVQIKPNLLSASQPLQVSVLNLTGNQSFIIRLFGIDGHEYYRSETGKVPSQTPVHQSVSTTGLPAGVYFVSVSDLQCRQRIQKFVLK